MPEEKMCTDVQASLDSLEHYYLENHLSRTQNYSVIYKALEKNDNLSSDEIQRLLAICVHDLREDMQYAASIMYIIPAILSRVQMGKYDPHPDLLPSALGVIQLIKKIALLNKVESLKVICFDTLLSYPNDTLIAAAEHNEEVIEIFNLYCQTVIPTEIRLQACSVLHKLLKILPPEKKQVFVEKGITVWFSKIIPIIMSHVSVASTNCDEAIEKIEENVEILELLTNELVACDYSQNESWHSVLECICNAQKYPAVMKNLLQKGSNIWHRLWIVFIRLLKNQVTLLLGVIGTPINSMLPVVEAAFKMDVDNRCKAFACWNVLIDSFSTETNESNITKRIKLLIIPLKSNNAKAEATALAKFKCWWHLITKFQNKIDKFLDNILVSFLNFCFGRHNATDKTVLIPGQISVIVKKLCIQAIVDMVGHDNCDGCTHLPKLKGKLITTKNLVDNWNHWVFSLTSTIMMSANTDHGFTKRQMTCLWKSFLMTIGELPENNIRKDLFSEILSILLRLVQECKSNSKLADIVFNALVLSLFDGDIGIKQLLKTRNDINGPLCKIVDILLDPSLKLVYQSYNFRDMVTKLKPVTNVVLDPVFSSPNLVIGYTLNALSESDNALILWTSLVESICESNYDVCAQILCDIMMWPLKTINSFTYDIKIPAMLWYTTNDVLYSKLMKTDAFDKAISKFLFTSKEATYSSVYFKLSVTLSVIKHKLTEESFTGYEKEIKLLQILTNHIDSYQSFAPLFPILIDRVLALISILVTNVNETLTRNILICVRIMVTVMTQACNQLTDVSEILAFVGTLLKSVDSLFKVESYHKLLPVIVTDLITCTPFLSKQPLTKSLVHAVMITFSKIVENKSTLSKIKTIIDEIENDTIVLEKNQSSDKNEFPTPKTKVAKKAKKKETSIVNTVVENGEEYLVVKSNWKFNPRKLTENQKEKLQRKREDIPALYQDLSQSQDEFKLVSWKTDSQDTSNSSKSESKSFKSSNNETASDMLLNLPSSNVVPKILENFFSENMKKESPAHAKDSLSIDNNVNKMGAATPKNTKSPRMALKDRVFRNVRNLIEKSGGIQKENKDASEDLNKTENIIKTPIQSQSNDAANIVNSAPPLLSADRPSRVKRKPKKFDELQLLTAKKSRQSMQDFKSNDKSEQPDLVTNPLKSSPDKDVIIIEDVGSPTVSVYEEEEVNEPVDLQGLENQTISDVNVVIESNENSQKDVSKINNAMDVVIEAQNIEVGHKEKHFTCLDLDISSDTEKNNEKSNGRKVESFNNIKDEGSINKKGEMSNDIKDENSNNNEDETCSANSNGSSNNNKKAERAKDIKDDSSNNKKGEKSHDIQDEKSNIKEGETSNDNKNGRSNDKKSEKSNYTMDETSISKTGEKSNDKKTESTNDNKDEKFNNKKVENSNDKKDEESNDKEDENSSEKETSSSTIDLTGVLTPQQISKNKGIEEQKSTTKKKKSRIEKELAIDTVEGHPFLKNQSEKRLTRKALESAGTVRRKSLAEKLNKLKPEANSVAKSEKKTRGKNKEGDSSHSSFTVDESQDKDSEIKDQTSFTEDIPYSDDVIESSQDSTITTISVKSTKKTTKKVPVVALQKMKLIVDKIERINESQSILDCVIVDTSDSSLKAFQESKDDIELPVNKTAFEEKSQNDITENMDTEPIDEKELSDVILINDDVSAPLTISSSETEVGPETQEIAEADTQPTDPKDFMHVDVADKIPNESLTVDENTPNKTPSKENKLESLTNNKSISEKSVNPSDNTTITLSESACALLEKESGSSSPSPFRDEAKRKQDFLNNTLEISPIKNMSPERNKKSPSPETSSDYVVIKLSSPVHSNGEPFEKCGSPEVFTADKDSPDKRDQSPPRVEVTVINTSPSSSLSLKKNRPQVRSGGRAAQMLGLCVPGKLQAIMNPEKIESEEVKKTSASSTPARRNLRILYNSASENTVPTSENVDSENFLKFRRSLPAVDSSPSVPILKRKLIEITDDATISPAGKRKRVSFHDPPVSTTISVQKYIEPGGLRSPQNSANKRLERQLRQQTPLKSPKRLDHAFKLDTVLTKAIESFSETEAISTPDDTQPFSLDETPVVEIVRASELNDTDPICPDLLDCKDPIDSIASELSSSAMKSLLVKELVGKVETVGDLAKMTELEVNRLCIKAPKVKVAKKVLSDYASRRIEKPLSDVMVKIDEAIFDEPMPDPDLKGVDIEVQTERNASSEMEVQTVETPTTATFVQTETTPTAHIDVQTDESGSKSTADIIKLCLEERPDFVEQVSVHLEESSIQQITDKLPFTAITDVLMKKVTPTNSKSLLNRILEEQWNNSPDDNRRSKELSLIKDFVCDRFDSKDLILFCSEVLKSVYDKPVYP